MITTAILSWLIQFSLLSWTDTNTINKQFLKTNDTTISSIIHNAERTLKGFKKDCVMEKPYNSDNIRYLSIWLTCAMNKVKLLWFLWWRLVMDLKTQSFIRVRDNIYIIKK